MMTEPTKLCNTCEIEFPKTTEFFYKRSTGYLEYQCKKCANLRKRRYDKTSAQRSKRTKQRSLDWYRSYKTSKICLDCGCTLTAVLEFHHLADKIISPSMMAWRGWGIKKMSEELNKCILLCVNCHRIRHYDNMKQSPLTNQQLADKKHKRLRAKKKLLLFIETIKKESLCIRCDNNDFRVLEFHHRDPYNKICDIAHMPKRGFGKQKIIDEIQKCDVLCGNCHRLTYEDQK